jgi:hypothetical protein
MKKRYTEAPTQNKKPQKIITGFTFCDKLILAEIGYLTYRTLKGIKLS